MHEAVDRAPGRRFDVDQAAVGADFEVFTAVLVGEWSPEDDETPYAGGQRYRAGDVGSGTAHGIDDLAGR